MMKFIKRKPIPKKTTYLKYGYVITEIEQQLCPRCKGILNAGPNYQPNYCGHCGQKLSFAGVEWKPDKDLGIDRDAWQEVQNEKLKYRVG